MAALEPFWADLSLDYGNNREFLDRRVVEAARLGDSVVPLLLEKLQPVQSSEAAQNLAGNCRRVLERLDPGSFVDALAELTRGSSSVARSEAIRLLGFARVPQAVAVLVDLADEAVTGDAEEAASAIALLRAAGVVLGSARYASCDSSAAGAAPLEQCILSVLGHLQRFHEDRRAPVRRAAHTALQAVVLGEGPLQSASAALCSSLFDRVLFPLVESQQVAPSCSPPPR